MSRKLIEIPAWIREVHKEPWFPKEHYLNAFQKLPPTETRLYGTESMYGDWDARILIILQDWCNSNLLETRLGQGYSDPWSHDPSMRTNKFLCKGFGPEGSEGILYASALANLLKKTEKPNGKPVEYKKVLSFLTDVMNFTLMNLPNLQAVVCFGSYAEEILLSSNCTGTDPKTVRNTGRSIHGTRVDGKALRIFAAKHPSRGYSYESIRQFADTVKSACWCEAAA